MTIGTANRSKIFVRRSEITKIAVLYYLYRFLFIVCKALHADGLFHIICMIEILIFSYQFMVVILN